MELEAKNRCSGLTRVVLGGGVQLRNKTPKRRIKAKLREDRKDASQAK
jgi:hypothetical protein